MEIVSGPITIAQILRDHFASYRAWKARTGQHIRPVVLENVAKVLACRTPQLGVHLYFCTDCGIVRVVPHSCKSRFCSSCGTAQSKAWSEEILSDLLEVPYRHVVFTIPWQARLLIQDNRERLQPILSRAAADAIFSLTRGTPRPLDPVARERMAHASRRYEPGIQLAQHTFGSAINWNPHSHMLITAGGLSLDGTQWVEAPARSLVSGPELQREWRLRVVRQIEAEHDACPLNCRRLRGDHRRRLNVETLLGLVERMSWHVHIGEALDDPEEALTYCTRYCRRPALGEARILRYDGRTVTIRYKDYRNGGGQAVKCLSAFQFLDRLTQHIPEKHARLFVSYGLFASRCKTKKLEQARKALGQRKRRPAKERSWEAMRKLGGEASPLACPQCKKRMRFWRTCFGNYEAIAEFVGVQPAERIPHRHYITAHAILKTA